MRIPKNSALLERARELRREMTPHERKLWYMFLRTYPVKFYKQRIISSFIADFYCHAAKLVIELDGVQHTTEEGRAYDAERTKILEKYGIEVLRFSNHSIDTDFPRVCSIIDAAVKRRLA
jgi:very-short-patch-repair endonuclease